MDYIHDSSTLLNSIGAGIIELDCYGEITYCNQHGMAIIGKSENEIRNTLFTDHFSICGDAATNWADIVGLLKFDGDEPLHSDDMFLLRKGDSLNRIMVTLTSKSFHDTNSYYIVFQKASERRPIITFDRDHLTGTFSRQFLEQFLQTALFKTEYRLHKCAILFIDLDGFKIINDTHGHIVGDALLKSVAGRIMNAVRRSDPVCRYGGDEFVVVIEKIEEESQVENIAKYIIEKVSRAYTVEQYELEISASVGIVLCGESMTSPLEALRLADKAMYVAKGKGGKRYHLASETAG